MAVFSIVLDSPNNAYFANTIANGYVLIHCSKPIKARSIEVAIFGRAEAAWIQHHSKFKTALFYIQEEFSVWKCQDSSNKLPAGEYYFPFQFFIPHDSPPVINAEFGNIRYWIDVEIDVPWGFNKSFRLEFSVCPFVDLNNDSRFAIPIAKHCQTSSNALKTITMRIPKMGYVCGESIPLHMEIGNNLISNVTSVEIGIEALFTFTAKYVSELSVRSFEDVTKIESKLYTLHNITTFPIESNYNVILSQNICIPPLPPSYDHCGFIKIFYRVFVNLHTKSKFYSGPIAYLPIVIGTVPLKEIITDVEPCMIGNEEYINPPIPTSITSELNIENVQFWEESCHTDLEGESEYSFKPKYPFFLNLSSHFPYQFS